MLFIDGMDVAAAPYNTSGFVRGYDLADYSFAVWTDIEWHIQTSSIPDRVSSEDNFGWYDTVNTAHLCSSSSDAHTVTLVGEGE